MDNKILNTEYLAVGHNKKILIKDINLNLYTGRLTCLLGKNGVGKSTLLHCLTGLTTPLKGQILIKNQPLINIKQFELAKIISIVLTQNKNPINLTVKEVVSIGRTPHTNWLGKLENKDDQIITEAMGSVNILGFANKQMHQLSDGERQRVMIAKALAQDTPIMILDEPTAHLDILNRVSLLNLLRNLAHKKQKAILLSIHELDMAIQLADMIWLIQNDTILTGTPEDLILQNQFNNSFDTDYIKFIKKQGNFLVQFNKTKSVYLEGTGLKYYWTQKALEKNGYEINRDKNNSIKIKIEPSEWILFKNATHPISCSSIGLLLAKIS